MSEEIKIDRYVRISETGKLRFFLKPEPSQECKDKLIEFWRYSRKQAAITMEPSGELDSKGNQLIIERAGPHSEQWQGELVQKIIALVNHEIAKS